MSSNFLTILDYTSSSGSRFQLTTIKNDSLCRTCAFLDTTILLYENYGNKKMTALANKIESIKGVSKVMFVGKFRLHIEKGNLFDWGNIAIQVIEVLEKTLEQKEESGEC
jgi:hypothetical protein